MGSEAGQGKLPRADGRNGSRGRASYHAQRRGSGSDGDGRGVVPADRRSNETFATLGSDCHDGKAAAKTKLTRRSKGGSSIRFLPVVVFHLRPSAFICGPILFSTHEWAADERRWTQMKNDRHNPSGSSSATL